MGDTPASIRAALRAVGLSPARVDTFGSPELAAARDTYRNIAGVDPCDPGLDVVALASFAARAPVRWDVLGPVTLLTIWADGEVAVERAVERDEPDALWRVMFGTAAARLAPAARRAAVAALVAGNSVRLEADGTLVASSAQGVELFRVDGERDLPEREIRLRTAFRVPSAVVLGDAFDRAWDARRSGRAAHFDGTDVLIETESGAVETVPCAVSERGGRE